MRTLIRAVLDPVWGRVHRQPITVHSDGALSFNVNGEGYRLSAPVARNGVLLCDLRTVAGAPVSVLSRARDSSRWQLAGPHTTAALTSCDAGALAVSAAYLH